MFKEILIQVTEHETAAAVVENNLLVEFYLERNTNHRLVGNIYKGIVENVLPGMQAAFIDIGLDKNAFLYVQEAIPWKMTHDAEEGTEKKLPPISIGDVVKVGQEIVVQIAKEPIGTKGARVTTHITLPGRYLVLMPTVDYIGISRRIERESDRNHLKDLAEDIRPKGMGIIVRTVAEGIQGDELKNDVEVLTKLWKKVQHKSAHNKAPSIIHKDLELLQRILRDLLTDDVDRVVINTKEATDKATEVVDIIAPQLKNKILLRSTANLFDDYDIPTQIEKALRRKVWLKCGGYIVIDQTEALTAIDVNTGKFVGSTNLEDTVLKTNLEAAVEIARQLRLRNIGGMIIIDFIDMDELAHQARVVSVLEEEVKRDKTRTNIMGITQLGLVELTRKKIRQALESMLQRECPYCEGRGKILSEDTVSLKARREILTTANNTRFDAVLVEAHPWVAAHLIGPAGANLEELERRTYKKIIIKGNDVLHIEDVRMRGAEADEIESLSTPVKVGQILTVRIEEPHSGHERDGIARLQGFVIDVEGGGPLLGQDVEVEITKLGRTFAKAKLVRIVKNNF